MVKKALFVALVFVLFFGFSSISLAQTPLILSISPDYPSPGETIFLSVESYSVDLAGSLIRWTVGGKTIKEGAGERQFSVKAGAPGSTLSIDVSVTTNGGLVYRDGLTVTPAEVTLLWKSDGYVPPFYRGGAPYVLGGTATFTAIPEFFGSGGRINPKSLIYTWKQNGKTVQSASGYGKTTFSTSEISYTRLSKEVEVEVSSPTENFVAKASVSLPPYDPITVFYEDNPLYGTLFNTALGRELILSENETVLFAVPYFFSNGLNVGVPNLGIDWSIDGRGVGEYKNKNKITLQKSGEPGSRSSVLISTTHPAKQFQASKQGINITIPNNETN